MKKVEESKNSADTSNVMYPGDVTIEYPPRINNAVNNSVVSEKSKDEMSLDEYKQWVMNQISQFPVSGWVRSTFSSGSIVIKEEAFERMKNDPEYENYVLNRVRSAYSVQGLPVGSNNVSFDVIGASPEECYGYAGPVGKSGSETANDGESWWEKRHERMEELMKEQEKEAVKRAHEKGHGALRGCGPTPGSFQAQRVPCGGNTKGRWLPHHGRGLFPALDRYRPRGG